LTAPAVTERGLLQGLLAGLRDEGTGAGTAGLIVALRGPQAGARSGSGSGPVFQFDLKPGGELLVSPVAAQEGRGKAPLRTGEGTAYGAYLVLIPSDELPASGEVVARLEREAIRSFFDPSGQTLVLEMPRLPFRPGDRNEAFAPPFELVPRELGDLGPNELPPAAWGGQGPAEGASQARGDGGGLGVAGLAGPRLPQSWANDGPELSDGVGTEVEADGLAEWAVPESTGQALLPAPDEGPGPAWVELVPLGNNSLSVVPALLAPPAGGAGPAGGVSGAEWASPVPDDGSRLAPPRGRSDPGPCHSGLKAISYETQANPTGLPPAAASPFPEFGQSWVRDLLLRLVTEREGSSPSEPVLDALFLIGLWGVGQEKMQTQGRETRPTAAFRL
jgi:hypothetical protein